jgi:hypothetical protein
MHGPDVCDEEATLALSYRANDVLRFPKDPSPPLPQTNSVQDQRHLMRKNPNLARISDSCEGRSEYCTVTPVAASSIITV